MNNLRTIFLTASACLISAAALADTVTWTYVCDKSRSSGGEGWWYTVSNSQEYLTETLQGIDWTAHCAEIPAYGYTATSGQMVGTTNSPVTHIEFTTEGFSGAIYSITVEARTKEATQTVALSAKVGEQNYLCEQSQSVELTTDFVKYTFTPESDTQNGTVAFIFDQTSETKGAFYFYSITVVYEGAKPELLDPELSYPLQEMTLEAGDDAYANYLHNPHNVGPITYKAVDESVAVIGNNGNIFTIAAGDTEVLAIFEGNDQYKAATASYTLHVVAKPVIAAPTADIPEGTYSEPFTVTITSDDPACKAIWYSTTAKDSTELIDEPIIVPGNVAEVLIEKSCTLHATAVDYNNIGCVLTLTYVIDTTTSLSAIDKKEEAGHAYNAQGMPLRTDAKQASGIIITREGIRINKE